MQYPECAEVGAVADEDVLADGSPSGDGYRGGQHYRAGSGRKCDIRRGDGERIYSIGSVSASRPRITRSAGDFNNLRRGASTVASDSSTHVSVFNPSGLSRQRDSDRLSTWHC